MDKSKSLCKKTLSLNIPCCGFWPTAIPSNLAYKDFLSDAKEDFSVQFSFATSFSMRSTLFGVNGFEAYEVLLSDNSGEKPVDYQFYWIKTDKVLFNMMGVSYVSQTETVSAVANSIRNLTEDQKSEIAGLKLRVATAQEGETIDILSSRTNNYWDVETTALKNGLETNVVLKEGQVLKIAVEEPYMAL